MQIKPRAYPHPVLATFNTDVDIRHGNFQSTVMVAPSKTAYTIRAQMVNSNDDLTALIASGAATFAVHVECSTTRFRRLEFSANRSFEFEINASDVDRRVDVCSFILATQDIERYSNAGFHDDYQGAVFRVRKGDTLAVGADQSFQAEKHDPLKKLSSIFSIARRKSDDAAPIDVDLTDDKIRIRLSSPNYAAYQQLKTRGVASALNTMVVFPALLEALRCMEKAHADNTVDDMRNLSWFRAIEKRQKLLGLDAESDSLVAQASKLIGDPHTHGLSELQNSLDEET